MSISYGIAQLVDHMEQEGCAGCAENLLMAVRENDPVQTRSIVAEAISHIEEDGYNDGQAEFTIEMLRTWLEETAPATVDP